MTKINGADAWDTPVNMAQLISYLVIALTHNQLCLHVPATI